MGALWGENFLSSARLELTSFCFADLRNSSISSVPSGRRSYKFSVALEATSYKTYKICQFVGLKDKRKRRKLPILNTPIRNLVIFAFSAILVSFWSTFPGKISKISANIYEASFLVVELCGKTIT